MLLLCVCVSYAKQFAEHYATVIQQTAESIFEKVVSLFDAIFSNGVPESAKSASEYLRSRMHELLRESQDECQRAINTMVAQNTEYDLIFTPNEHYLSELVKNMIAEDENMASDSGGPRHIYHNVRAFIKVQRKVISELAAKEMVRTLVLHSERAFNVLVSSQISEYVQYIKEPAHIKRDRDTLLQRRRVLVQALERVNAVSAGR